MFTEILIFPSVLNNRSADVSMPNIAGSAWFNLSRRGAS